MKTRVDFVSNSSSCSFIIAANKQYDFMSMIEDICFDCVEKTECAYDQTYIDRVNHENSVNLYFNLKNFELLFLGSLIVKDQSPIERITISKRHVEWFFYDYMFGERTLCSNEKFSEKSIRQLIQSLNAANCTWCRQKLGIMTCMSLHKTLLTLHANDRAWL